MSTILVIGGAGYIGSVLVPLLTQHHHDVQVIDLLLYGEDSTKSWESQVTVTQADMRNIPEQALAGVDTVINLGGLSNDPTANYDPAANWELNYEAVVKLAEHCKRLGVQRYIFASSCAIYDRLEPIASTREPLVEDVPIEPVGHYSKAKYAAEQRLLSMQDEHFNITILRKGTVFGYSPRMRFDLVINAMVHDAMIDGTITVHGAGYMWRPLIDVQDVAEAYLKVVECPIDRIRGQIFNIAYRNISIADLSQEVQAALQEAGIECHIQHNDMPQRSRDYCASTDKAKRVLGFQAHVSIHESVLNMVHHLKDFSRIELNHPRYYNIRWMQYNEGKYGK